MGRQVILRTGESIRLLALALVVGLTGGCRFSLPDDLYVLSGAEACAQIEDLDGLVERVAGYGPTTPTAELRCALSAFRDARASSIHQTSAPAKVSYLLADRHNGANDREILAAEGVRWAEIALEGDPALVLYGIRGDETKEEGRVYYYQAVNLGIAVHDHTALAIKNLKKLARALQKAVRLSPAEEHGGPLRVLGLLYLVAPPWPQGIGDGDKALDLLQRAASEYPDHPLNHIFYAQALHEVEEDDEQVKHQLDLSNQLLDKYDWGDARERWHKLLADLAKEAHITLVPMP